MSEGNLFQFQVVPSDDCEKSLVIMLMTFILTTFIPMTVKRCSSVGLKSTLNFGGLHPLFLKGAMGKYWQL